MLRAITEWTHRRLSLRRGRRRGHARGVGLLALAAMVAQLLLPLAHGPCGHSCWDADCHDASDRMAAAGDQSGPRLKESEQGRHDSATCPVCVTARTLASQPYKPVETPALGSGSAATGVVAGAPAADPCSARIVVGSGPRGPPVVC